MRYGDRVPCPVPGCPGTTRPRMVACRRCWYRLPRTLRAPIAAAATDPKTRTVALTAAGNWFTHHPLPRRDRAAGGGALT